MIPRVKENILHMEGSEQGEGYSRPVLKIS
jgi:hypothetical protein